MNTYKFFVRNVIIKKAMNADFIFAIINDDDAKQTPFVAHNEKSPVKRANEMKAVADHEKYGGSESKAYFAALKAFMAMGFNKDMTFTVDDNNNVSVSI